MDDPRGLQHQRQHQDVRPLQPPAGSAAVPGSVVVLQRHAAAPLPDDGAGQEPVGLRDRLADARLQSQHDQRNRLRIYFHRLPERIRGSLQGGSRKGRFQLQAPLQEWGRADPEFRRRLGSGPNQQLWRLRDRRSVGGAVCEQVAAEFQRHGHQGLGQAHGQGRFLLGVDPQCPAGQRRLDGESAVHQRQLQQPRQRLCRHAGWQPEHLPTALVQPSQRHLVQNL